MPWSLGATSFDLELRDGAPVLFESGAEPLAHTNIIRLAEGGPVGQRMFSESRVQLSWSSSGSKAALEMPTTRVIDAFTSGGAQVTGGQDAFALEAATDLDHVRGSHAWRFGGLIQGGKSSRRQ